MEGEQESLAARLPFSSMGAVAPVVESFALLPRSLRCATLLAFELTCRCRLEKRGVEVVARERTGTVAHKRAK